VDPVGRTEVPADGWPRQRYAELGAQIAHELTALHEAGTVLGGLTPNDVTLNLADYPTIARPAAPACAPYGAPEARAGAPTPASDVYTLGALLFHWFTGEEPPAPGAFPSGALSQAPAGLEHWVRLCLDASPTKRPPLSRVAQELMRCALLDQHPPSDDRDSEGEWGAPSGTRPTLSRLSDGLGLSTQGLDPKPADPPAPAEVERASRRVGPVIVLLVLIALAAVAAVGHHEGWQILG
jgi:serine/threonine protein kinase